MGEKGREGDEGEGQWTRVARRVGTAAGVGGSGGDEQGTGGEASGSCERPWYDDAGVDILLLGFGAEVGESKKNCGKPLQMKAVPSNCRRWIGDRTDPIKG